MASKPIRERLFNALVSSDPVFAQKHGTALASRPLQQVTEADLSAQDFDLIGKAVHEANRKFSRQHGDFGQLPWADIRDDVRRVVYKGILVALNGAGPEALHDAWVNNMLAEGWVWGAVKDAQKKTHPSLVPYYQLSPVEQAKDTLFYQTAHEAYRRLKG